MILDGLVILLILLLVFNGWKQGLLRSWHGIVAIILATFVVQHFYIDFSTWIMSRLYLNPKQAVVVGYLMLWLGLMIVTEIVLGMVIRSSKVTDKPNFIDRLAGAIFGLVKALIIVILPLMATIQGLKVELPPTIKAEFKFSEISVSEDTHLVAGLHDIAKSLMPTLGKYVVSDASPSFKPQYNNSSSGQNSIAPNEPAKEKPVDKSTINDLLK